MKQTIITAVKRMKPRHYFSQPMPEAYSTPFKKAMGHPQHTMMQLAFARAVGMQ